MNYVDWWGLQCKSSSDRPIYYDDYGNPSYDPHVVTGKNVGEDIPTLIKILEQMVKALVLLMLLLVLMQNL